MLKSWWKRFGDWSLVRSDLLPTHFELAKWDSNGASPDKFVPISRFPTPWMRLMTTAWPTVAIITQKAIASQNVGVRGKSTSKPYSDTADTRNPIHETTETSFSIECFS